MSDFIKDGVSRTPERIRSFLMAGQSNMAGRGDIADVPPISNPRCYMLRNGRFQRMSEPVNPDRAVFEGKYRSGISLAASFADEYQKTAGADVGLIPCADGGTVAALWQPGTVLFDNAVFQAKLAMRSSDFRGILWHQGESDCKTFSEEKYTAELKAVFEGFRLELGGDFPIVMGEISHDIDVSRWNIANGDVIDRMNRTLANIASEVPNCVLVSAAGLSLKPDGIHFDSASCRIFGERYFNAYRELVNGNL